MGIGSLVCINNLLITPVGNVLMRLAVKAKELRILVGSDFFSNLETIIVKTILVPGITHSYSDKLVP